MPMGSFLLKMPMGSFFLKMPCKNILMLENYFGIEKDAHGHFSKDAQIFQSKEGILQEDYLLTL